MDAYNRAAEANNWNEYRRFQIVGGYLEGAAAKWFDMVKNGITGWNTFGGFTYLFKNKFASPTRKNTWYLSYKACKQDNRMVDKYQLEFQALLRKIDPQQTMPRESIIVDFMAGLSPTIALLVYRHPVTTLEAVIQVAKMIELG